MVKRLLAFLLASGLGAYGAAYTSTTSGLFSAGSTWVGGVAPSANGDTWTIASGHTVWYDVDNSGHANGWGASTVTGTLAITNDCYLKMGGSLSGAGKMLVGTESEPIEYTDDNRPSVVVAMTAGYIAMTGEIKWYGNTNHFVGQITNTVSITGDSTNLFFSTDVVGVASNDVVYVSNHDIRGPGGDYHLVYEVATNRITLFDAIPSEMSIVTNLWPGMNIVGAVPTNNRTNGTYVVKLSRPIVALQPVKLSFTALFNGCYNGRLEGVRVSNLGIGALYNVIYWQCTSVVVTTCALGFMSREAVFRNCVVAGGNGGLVGTANGLSFYDCVGVNTLNGGLVSGSRDIKAVSCIGINCSGGAIAQGCYVATLAECIGVNSLNGLVYNGGGHVLYYCRAVNHAWPLFGMYPTEMVLFCTNNSSLFEDLINVYHARSLPYTVSVINGTNFLAHYGRTVLTNMTTPFGGLAYAHYPTTNDFPLPWYLDVAVKPMSERRVDVAVYGKANCGYAYAVTEASMKPLTVTNLSAGTGWTTSVITISNALPVPVTKRLWLAMTNSGSVTPGWSAVNLPTDYTISWR